MTNENRSKLIWWIIGCELLSVSSLKSCDISCGRNCVMWKFGIKKLPKKGRCNLFETTNKESMTNNLKPRVCKISLARVSWQLFYQKLERNTDYLFDLLHAGCSFDLLCAMCRKRNVDCSFDLRCAMCRKRKKQRSNSFGEISISKQLPCLPSTMNLTTVQKKPRYYNRSQIMSIQIDKFHLSQVSSYFFSYFLFSCVETR